MQALSPPGSPGGSENGDSDAGSPPPCKSRRLDRSGSFSGNNQSL